jgi:hypothetical protein
VKSKKLIYSDFPEIIIQPQRMEVGVFDHNLEFEKVLYPCGFSDYMDVVNKYQDKSYKDQLADSTVSTAGIDSLFIPNSLPDLNARQLKKAIDIVKGFTFDTRII